jgi:hypothetical protein
MFEESASDWGYESGMEIDPTRGNDTPAIDSSGNIEIFGIQTKNFDICPGAVVEFKRAMMLVNREQGRKATGVQYSQATHEVRAAASNVDEALGLEKQALADQCHSAASVGQMKASFDAARAQLNRALPNQGPWVDYAGLHLNKVTQLPQCATQLTPAAGWFSRGRLMWILGAAGLVWWLNRKPNDTDNISKG